MAQNTSTGFLNTPPASSFYMALSMMSLQLQNVARQR